MTRSALLFSVLVGGAASLVDCAARADDDPAVVLARSCWGEAGVSLHECAAIGEVYRRRHPAGVVTAEGVRAYSVALRRPSRAWLLELGPSGARPASWPERLSWAVWRPRWERLLSHARRIVRGEVRPACAPDHFGGAMDHWRALRAGWEEVDCGPTRNRFYRVR